MKNILRLSLIALFSLFVVQTNAQDDAPAQEPEQLNLPGDNLNLYAVMKLFQESATLEEFEKKLNDPTLKVNNLDLDGDNKIDYIKVVDNVDGDIHNIALKVDVNKDQDQDVAVFVVKKENNGQVAIQLIGDEALYGKNYIIEPNSGSSTPTPNPGYTGDQPMASADADYVATSSWPVVQFIYVPTYSVWRSPYHWGYYPSYWEPWTPFFWHEYYGYQYHWDYYYRAHYRYTPVYRFPSWHQRYYGGGLRSSAPIVQVRFNSGSYRQTYSRPDLASRGADLFRRDHPTAPSVNRPLPRFDNNNNNRPIVNRSDRDRNGNGNRPGENSPNRPTDNNGNRPDNAGNGNNGRPANPNNNNNNGNTGNGNNNTPNRPYTGNNFPRRPGARPADGNNNTPAPGNTPVRPATRPVNSNPGNNTPGGRPSSPNQGNNRPANRPNGNNFPARPVDRPAPPPRQQQQAPRQQPAGRPIRDHQ